MNQPKNILIVRTDRIGDVVLSLPLAAIIKKHFPECKVSFLLREYTKPLAVNNPNIDEVITLIEENEKPSIAKNIALLKKINLPASGGFDVCIVAYPTYPIALILFLSNIKTRIGTGYRWYSFLFNHKNYEHRKYGEYHELEYNVHLLRHLGIDEKVTEENVLYGITPSIENEERVKKDLNELGINFSKPVIIVHPGSGGSAVDLPISKLKEIVNNLYGENVEILITGTTTEKELCQSLVVNKSTKNLAGRYDLGGLIALINQCDVIIANSTGPIHIAAALGKNVIGFYPRFTAASAKRWGPYTNKKNLFSPTIDCTNCTRKQCEKLNCMDSIKTEDVVAVAKSILNKRFTEKK